MVSEWLFLAAEESPKAAGQFPGTLIFIVAIFMIFWFLILRPQKRREQQRKEMIAGIRKNDDVVTAGGIYGKVRDLTEDSIILEVDSKSGLTLKITRGSITRVLLPDQADEKRDHME